MDPFTIVALALGTVQSLITQRNANKRQQRILDSATRRASEQADAGVEELTRSAQQFAPTTRSANYEQTAEDRAGDLAAVLPAGADSGATAGGGRVSDAFLLERARTAADRTREGLDSAKRLARYGAFDDLSLAENIRQGSANAAANRSFGNARNLFTIGRQDAANVQPDPYGQALGSLLIALGASGLGKSGDKTLQPYEADLSGAGNYSGVGNNFSSVTRPYYVPVQRRF